jgi:hypothetical protein
MNMKRTIGAMMLVTPFAAIGTYCYVAGGALAVASVFGMTALVCGFIVGGIALMESHAAGE